VNTMGMGARGKCYIWTRTSRVYGFNAVSDYSYIVTSHDYGVNTHRGGNANV
jgi:hypothetical protein